MKNAEKRIRELRKALGMSLEKFSKETDISFSLLSKIETGVVNITPEVLKKIANRWQVNENWLFHGKGEMSFSEKMPPPELTLVNELKTEVTLWRTKYDELFSLFSRVISNNNPSGITLAT